MMSSAMINLNARSLRRHVGLIHRQFGTIAEEKAAAKEQRRKRWHEKQERLSGLQTRRDGRPRDVKRKEFREWHDKRRIYQEIMDKKARQEGLDWKIKVAAVVERLPIVLPDKEPWEKDYLELRRYLDQFDFEYPSELGMDDLVDDFDYDGEAMDLPVPEGAEEFVPPPRETEADASGDTKTLDRRLKTRIYFALMENENSWGFPSSDLQPEETLREAAERVTKEKLGEDMEFVALSNCPIAVDLKVDKNDTYYGTKTFYMKIQYTKGTPQRLKGAMDYGWLDRTELSEKAMMTGGESARKFFHYML